MSDTEGRDAREVRLTLDLLYDEGFPHDPYMSGALRAEMERMGYGVEADAAAEQIEDWYRQRRWDPDHPRHPRADAGTRSAGAGVAALVRGEDGRVTIGRGEQTVRVWGDVRALYRIVEP